MTSQEYLIQHSLDEQFVTEKLAWQIGETFITIPIYDSEGKFLYNRYRHLEGDRKFTSDTGAHPALYNLHAAKHFNQLVLCEGEPDCARLWQESIPAVTGTSGVKTLSPELFEPLRGKLIYLLLDSDEPGQTSVEKYVEILHKLDCTVLIMAFDTPVKDVCDYFASGKTKEDFEALKDEAVSWEEWQESHEPEEFKLETLQDIITKDIPEEEWLIERVLPAEGFTFIVGAEATGKSFYTLTLAYSIVNGTPWLGQFPVKKTTRVLFMDKENSQRRIQSRCKGLGINPGSQWLFRMKMPHLFNLVDSQGQLSDFARSLSRKVVKNDIGLIVLDSFADFMVGNENSAEDVQQFFNAMRELFPDRSILVLHHENKPSQGVTRNSSQRVRGSSNITAQIVSGFRVFSLPKTGNEFVLEQFKAGDSEKLKPFKVQLVAKPHHYNPDKTYVAEVKYGGEYYDEEGKAEQAEELVSQYFDDQPTASRKELLDFLAANGVSQRTTDRVIRDMVNEGRLEKIRSGMNISYIQK